MTALKLLTLLLLGLFVEIHAQCPYFEGMISVQNGFISNRNDLRLINNNQAIGWIDFNCTVGFTLDPSIGSRVTCQNNGVWTATPVCRSTSRCSLGAILALVGNSTTAASMTLNGTPNLLPDITDTGNVLSGSFVGMVCNPGFVNIGGPLNITCVGNSWTPFPNCVRSGGAVTNQPTPMPPIVINTPPVLAGACFYNSSISNIDNGFPSNTSGLLIYVATSTATGWIMFSCTSGFTLDPSIGAVLSCNNGLWSPRPRCVAIPRCSLAALTSLMSGSSFMQTTPQQQLMQVPGENDRVLLGSYLVFACNPGYVNTGGNLNVTCNADGSWSQSPRCIQSSVPGTSGLPCPYSPSMLSIPNMYVTSSNLTSITPNQVITGSYIDFACLPSFTLVGSSRMTCVNGVFSPPPSCVPQTMTSLNPTLTTLPTNIQFCSFSTSMLSIPNMMSAIWNNLILATPNQAMPGSYIDFTCLPSFTMVGSSRVTCINGTFTPLPSCVPQTMTSLNPTLTTLPTNVQFCSFSTSMLSLPNMYVTSSNLTSITPNQVITGSYIDFACLPSFTLVGSSRMTCVNGVFSPPPSCVPQTMTSLNPTLTTLPTNIQFCSFSTSMLSIPNMMSAVWNNLILATPNQAMPGSYIDFTCLPSFTMVGSSRVTCINGTFTPLPSCVPQTAATTTPIPSSNGCPYSQNMLVIPNGGAAGVPSLIPISPTQVAIGSFIDYMCMPNFSLVGNPRVTCTTSGFTPAPTCVATGSVITTTPTLTGPRCSGLPSVANGFIANATLIDFGNNQYQGSILFGCNAGYVLVTVGVDRWISCVNGVWSSTSMCSKSATCPFQTLQSSISNLVPTASRNLTAFEGNILAGSWILFECRAGTRFDPTSGSLNVTCPSTGIWPPFPRCI